MGCLPAAKGSRGCIVAVSSPKPRPASPLCLQLLLNPSCIRPLIVNRTHSRRHLLQCNRWLSGYLELLTRLWSPRRSTLHNPSRRAVGKMQMDRGIYSRDTSCEPTATIC